MTALIEDAVDRFDAAVSRGRRRPALDVVEGLVAAGVDPMTVLTDVIAAVQRRVGERWQRGEWSVAQEHAATALSLSALEAVDRTVRTPGERGHVVVACAEREWHALPASMVSAGLRLTGWDVTLLGASTPTGRLSHFLQDLGPDATAVSCSVPEALPYAHDFIVVSTTAGIPAMAGGSAFGPDDRRARALGATAWAPDARTAVELAGSLPVVVPAAAALPEEVARERSRLQQVSGALAELVVWEWRGSAGPAPEDDSGSEARELLHTVALQAVHAVLGALVTGDGRLVEETAAWVGDVARWRGLGDDTVGELGRCLADALADHPLSAELWRQGWPA